MKSSSLFLVALLFAGCGETGQARVEVPLFVAGTAPAAPLLAAGDLPVELERAELAFGPLTLCAGFQAGELCETARLEWLSTVVIDTLDPVPQEAGELRGVTGHVRSWMYDLGISSQLSRREPFALEASKAIGGVSLRLLGNVELNGITLPFSAAIAVQQDEETELGVPVVRKSTSDDFSHEVEVDEPGLLIRFDPAAWIRSIDFRAYVEDVSCAIEGPAVRCAGNLEQRCAPDGTVTDARDCGALGQACLVEHGCAKELLLEPGDGAFRGLRNALVSGQRPAFTWGFSQ